MSAEHNPAVDTVSLRDYLEAKLTAMEKVVSAALSSSERAICKAEDAANKRFESVNEFRATLADNARQFMPRLEYEQAHRSMVDKLDAYDKKMDDLKRELLDKIADVGSRLDRQDLKTKDFGIMSAYIVGGLGFIATLINVIYYLLAIHSQAATTVISNSK